MALTLDGTSGIVSSGSITTQSATGVIFSDSSNQVAAASPFSLKNRIINGDMVIDQRNAGASITGNDGVFPVDRFSISASQSSKMTARQNAGSVTPPTGFTNYLGITSSSAYTVGASEVFTINQRIEGFNFADCQWGTANAKTVTLSFQVYSSLTGTFGGVLQNSAVNRSYPFTYSIPTANTWTTISITIAGDTTGTWIGATNGTGLIIRWGLGVGSTVSGTANSWASATYYSATGATSVVGTNGATFYITGVQLERNTTATPFEWIPYGMELSLCQRYFQQLGSAVGVASASNFITGAIQFFTPMRTTPTVSTSNLMTVTDTNAIDATQSSTGIAIVSGTRANNLGMNFTLTNLSGLTTNKLFITVPTVYSNGLILVSAEL